VSTGQFPQRRETRAREELRAQRLADRAASPATPIGRELLQRDRAQTRGQASMATGVKTRRR